MKYMLIILSSIFLLTETGNAQQKIPVPIEKKVTNNNQLPKLPGDNIHIVANTIVAPGIEVYEFQGFRGRKVAFIRNVQGKFEFPFPVTHVSIKVPDSLILYIKTCFEFPAENAYVNNQGDISLEYLCGVRTDERVYVEVSMGGISTEVHNRDCTRFNGDVIAKMWEKGVIESDAIEILLPGMSKATPTSPYVAGQYKQTLFHNVGHRPIMTTSTFNYEGFDSFVFNNNPVLILTRKALNVPHRDSGSRRETGAYQFFCAGRNAIREGRVKLEVKTNLICSHKSCDLCSDYKSMIQMAAPVTAWFPINKLYDGGRIINASHPYVIAGPYEAKPYIRDVYTNTYFFDFYDHLVKNFRVHLIIGGL